ncbi:metallophosphoesterase family protein [Roseomonas marmotae]|uniref:Metallophosphoesterase family protein n=1 Tax=Roseomonas marmotae TaxID=2768161 RepID=A0ABS3KC55_9PROT|nr:metallophosphoesterase family protein [Roseomonas marmotae]MBO1074223.1 metallophosphoesterase family protein [Roseomonas marmotae]QTI78988.1 metallophosphoesterase family protein [Roseomonas marmotae]
MTVFFTADTHFGHAGARALYRRPFPDVRAMDAALLERWNAVVGPEDEVWHLGDFALGPTEARMQELLARLNGRKHLITGNNDGPRTTSLTGWASVAAYRELELEGVGLVLCHYAFRSWRSMAKGWWNLHGHSHGRLKPLPRQADLGVDIWDFRPVPLADILAARGSRRAGRGEG